MQTAPEKTPDGTEPPAAPPPTVEEAVIANILAKLRAGKVLTDREEKRLRAYQERQEGGANPDDVAGKVADSMEQAAALSGYSKDRLQLAKQHGCPAFRGSRVYVDELVEWMTENGDSLPTGNTELDALNLEIAREKLRKARFANELEQGGWIRRTEVAETAEALGLDLKATLRKRLEEELPDRLANRPTEEIRPILERVVDELCEKFRERAKLWKR